MILVGCASGAWTMKVYAAPADPPGSPVEAAAGRARAERYVVVPIRGELGVETLASGVAGALARARERGVGRVLLVMDCEGGSVREAARLARVMRAPGPRLAVHALIEGRCEGPACVLLAFADTIHMRPGARIVGLAAPEGDDRAAGRLADEMESAAGAGTVGWDAAFFRALADPAEKLFAWRDDEGRPRLGNARPSRADAAAWTRLDAEGLPLRLDASVLDEWGLARMFEGSITQLGEDVGAPGWKAIPDVGERAMEEARRDLARLEARLAALRREVSELVDEAAREDPRKLKLKADSKGLLTGNSQVAWREAADRSIGLWTRVRELVRGAGALERHARDAGAEHLLPVFAEDIAREAERQLDWLARHRTRHYMDRAAHP